MYAHVVYMWVCPNHGGLNQGKHISRSFVGIQRMISGGTGQTKGTSYPNRTVFIGKLDFQTPWVVTTSFVLGIDWKASVNSCLFSNGNTLRYSTYSTMACWKMDHLSVIFLTRNLH